MPSKRRMGRRQSKETKMDGLEERPRGITRFKRQVAAAGLVGSGLIAGAVADQRERVATPVTSVGLPPTRKGLIAGR